MTLHTAGLARLFLALALLNAGNLALGQTPAAPPSATSAAPAPDLAAAVRARVEREVAAQGLVGISVALADDHSIVYSAGFGFQDREGAVPAAGTTMYRWASVSKPITAILALQLSHEGLLDLDADVRTYVPEFPEKPHTITARQLLCHQGGIVHYENGPVIRTQRTYIQDHPFESAILALDTFKDSPLVAEPGATYSYSTHGYMLLGAVVERAGKAPFPRLVRDRIIEPLRMTTLQPDYQWVRIPGRTKGYARRREDAAKPPSAPGTPAAPAQPSPATPSTDTDVSWKLPGGGFISTVDDMARLGIGLLGDRLLDPQTRAEAWKRQNTRDGKVTGYGYGFGVDDRNGRLVVSHSGSQEKTATFLLILPREQTGGVVVAVMCNTEGARLGPLAEDLARMLIRSRAHDQLDVGEPDRADD